MKLACIVPRYGAEISSGAERHCRLIAERLSAMHAVEVLTTCARDDVSWSNVEPEGADRIRGVAVRRFANSEPDEAAANEAGWLARHGPWCPALIDYLEQRHGDYDALIFFSCLHAPAALGLRIAPRRSILVPALQGPPPPDFEALRDVLALPAAIVYTTAAERGFVRSRFAVRASREAVIGYGVDLPTGFADAAPETYDEPPADDQRYDRSRGEDFRRRHRLFRPFALCAGHVRPAQGCEEMIEYFARYAAQAGAVDLALMGARLMEVPGAPFIRYPGTLAEGDRRDAFEAATVVLAPAPTEYLASDVLEAFAAGTPVLASARSDVLVDHCQRSNAGLYYADGDEFRECLELLAGNAELRARMGRNGQRYVAAQCDWHVVIDQYNALLTAVATRRRARTTTRPRRSRTRRGGGTAAGRQ